MCVAVAIPGAEILAEARARKALYDGAFIRRRAAVLLYRFRRAFVHRNASAGAVEASSGDCYANRSPEESLDCGTAGGPPRKRPRQGIELSIVHKPSLPFAASPHTKKDRMRLQS
jgi:hypothetical protein